jgi:hypothetical protein
MQRQEEKIQLTFCKIIDVKYPNLVYFSDSSGLHLPKGYAIKMSKIRNKKFKIPDMIFLHPNREFKGLCIELKKDRQTVYLKNGEVRNQEHLQEQKKSLEHLIDLGYCACFCCGIDEAMLLLDKYMRIPTT